VSSQPVPQKFVTDGSNNSLLVGRRVGATVPFEDTSPGATGGSVVSFVGVETVTFRGEGVIVSLDFGWHGSARGKQAWPTGHSTPCGHGKFTAQLFLASSGSVPQNLNAGVGDGVISVEFEEGIELVPLIGEGIADEVGPPLPFETDGALVAAPPTLSLTEGDGVPDGTASAAQVIPGKQVWPDGQLMPSGQGVLDSQFSAASK